MLYNLINSSNIYYQFKSVSLFGEPCRYVLLIELCEVCNFTETSQPANKWRSPIFRSFARRIYDLLALQAFRFLSNICLLTRNGCLPLLCASIDCWIIVTQTCKMSHSIPSFVMYMFFTTLKLRQ